MAVAENSRKIGKYIWTMNEIGKNNIPAGLTCTEYSSKNEIQTCVTRIKETKAQRREEETKQRMDDFRENFGKGKVKEVLDIKEQQETEVEER